MPGAAVQPGYRRMTEDTHVGAQQETLLLVDDDAANLRILHETLKAGSYRLLTARSGEQALAVAAKAAPDLILLDIVMPGIDGFETCATLKADPATSGSAVIFLSALDDAKDKVRGLEMGAVDYVSKPFHPEEVIARVETHLKIRRLERRLVENNRDLEAANERMRRDLEAAAGVQQSFLPQTTPDISGVHFAWRYRPCEELGGDSFDVWAFDERHVGMYVLDVTGHGVPSSLLAVTIARALSPSGATENLLTQRSDEPPGHVIVSPAEVAQRLNRMFPMERQTMLYFTLVYGILNLSTGEFRYVCAGHPGPIRAAADGSVGVHDTPAVPIGLLSDSDYQESLLRLDPGDRVYLHSDGISDERNAAGEVFGRERMMGVIAASRASTVDGSLDALIDAATRWRDGGQFRDDVAVVAFEYAGIAPGLGEATDGERERRG